MSKAKPRAGALPSTRRIAPGGKGPGRIRLRRESAWRCLRGAHRSLGWGAAAACTNGACPALALWAQTVASWLTSSNSDCMHICTARSKSSSVSCSLASHEPDRQGSAGSLLARPSTPPSTSRLCSRYSSSVISPSEKAWFRSRSRSMATARTGASRAVCTNELRPFQCRYRARLHVLRGGGATSRSPQTPGQSVVVCAKTPRRKTR